MNYDLLYHPEVISSDIPRLNSKIKKRVKKAIEERLGPHPEAYGRPLRGSLAGYWKLRVGDVRIVYRVVKKEVQILAIINRRDVYSDVLKRLSWPD